MRRIGLALLGCCMIAPARAADPHTGKFVVFFQQWSAALSANAVKVIGHASDFAKANPGARLHVNAFADPSAGRRASALLTDLRAQVVMDQLQKDGVPKARVLGRGHGSAQFALTPQESRRVEISVAGP